MCLQQKVSRLAAFESSIRQMKMDESYKFIIKVFIKNEDGQLKRFP